MIADDWEFGTAETEARAIAGKPDNAVAFAMKYIESQEKTGLPKE